MFLRRSYDEHAQLHMFGSIHMFDSMIISDTFEILDI